MSSHERALAAPFSLLDSTCILTSWHEKRKQSVLITIEFWLVLDLVEAISTIYLIFTLEPHSSLCSPDHNDRNISLTAIGMEMTSSYHGNWCTSLGA